MLLYMLEKEEKRDFFCVIGIKKIVIISYAI